MISFIEGKVVFKGERFIVINVNNVGYRVFCGPDVLRKAKKEEQIKLWTHLYVRENAMDLYGFLEYPELEFFGQLIQISGIGPKGALAVMSVVALDSLKKAIAAGETSYLTKVSGVGQRLAEKIILELKNKFGVDGSRAGEGVFKEREDALEALQALGYSLRQSREAIRNLPEGIEGTEQAIKEALRTIHKK